jgi:hypothetical protein
MDELDDLLTERVTFDDVGGAVLHALASMDSEGRAVELASYRLILAGDNEQARAYAQRSLEAADRVLLDLHRRLRAILREGDA